MQAQIWCETANFQIDYPRAKRLLQVEYLVTNGATALPCSREEGRLQILSFREFCSLTMNPARWRNGCILRLLTSIMFSRVRVVRSTKKEAVSFIFIVSEGIICRKSSTAPFDDDDSDCLLCGILLNLVGVQEGDGRRYVLTRKP